MRGYNLKPAGMTRRGPARWQYLVPGRVGTSIPGAIELEYMQYCHRGGTRQVMPAGIKLLKLPRAAAPPSPSQSPGDRAPVGVSLCQLCDAQTLLLLLHASPPVSRVQSQCLALGALAVCGNCRGTLHRRLKPRSGGIVAAQAEAPLNG